MRIEEHVAWMTRDINVGEYRRPAEHLVMMHPLKAALIMPFLYDRLHSTEKVSFINELQRMLLKHFVVEKHNVNVREFAKLNLAKLWADKNNGARLVEGEK